MFMDIKINETKFKNILFNYLNDLPELKNAQEHRSIYDSNVKAYYFETNFGEEDSPDYESVFNYFPEPHDYEEYHGVTSPYESSTYPLIEIDTYLYEKITGIFGERFAPQFLLQWMNNEYGLDANSIVEN